MVGEGVLLELAGHRGRRHSIAPSSSKSHYERHGSDGWYGSPKDPAGPIGFERVGRLFEAFYAT